LKKEGLAEKKKKFHAKLTKQPDSTKKGATPYSGREKLARARRQGPLKESERKHNTWRGGLNLL